MLQVSEQAAGQQMRCRCAQHLHVPPLPDAPSWRRVRRHLRRRLPRRCQSRAARKSIRSPTTTTPADADSSAPAAADPITGRPHRLRPRWWSATTRRWEHRHQSARRAVDRPIALFVLFLLSSSRGFLPGGGLQSRSLGFGKGADIPKGFRVGAPGLFITYDC